MQLSHCSSSPRFGLASPPEMRMSKSASSASTPSFLADCNVHSLGLAKHRETIGPLVQNEFPGLRQTGPIRQSQPRTPNACLKRGRPTKPGTQPAKPAKGFRQVPEASKNLKRPADLNSGSQTTWTRQRGIEGCVPQSK